MADGKVSVGLASHCGIHPPTSSIDVLRKGYEYLSTPRIHIRYIPLNGMTICNTNQIYGLSDRRAEMYAGVARFALVLMSDESLGAYMYLHTSL